MAELDGRTALSDDELLNCVPEQTRVALRSQVDAAATRDDILSVIHAFHDTLCCIKLPRPSSVELPQAIKDVKRETIQLGDVIFRSNPKGVQAELRQQLASVVFDKSAEEKLVGDILRAASRTSMGGDAYVVVTCLLGYAVVTPAVEATPSPILIHVVCGDGLGCPAEVTITCISNFILHQPPVDTRDGHTAAASSGKTNKRGRFWPKRLWPKRGFRKRSNASAPNEVDPISIRTETKVTLGLLEGSCKRTLSVKSPEIEVCPQQCLVLGAGRDSVNGCYDMLGFSRGAPHYKNKNGVVLSREGTSWTFRHSGLVCYVAREQSEGQAEAREPPAGQQDELTDAWGSGTFAAVPPPPSRRRPVPLPFPPPPHHHHVLETSPLRGIYAQGRQDTYPSPLQTQPEPSSRNCFAPAAAVNVALPLITGYVASGEGHTETTATPEVMFQFCQR